MFEHEDSPPNVPPAPDTEDRAALLAILESFGIKGANSWPTTQPGDTARPTFGPALVEESQSETAEP